MPFCSKCGREVSEDIKFALSVGRGLRLVVTPENTSGQGESAIVPEEVKG